jgi:GNAT superfamily N-acetyltransferase
MTVDVEEERTPALTEYARVPIAFTVREVADVVEAPNARQTFALRARVIEQPYVKDYDGDGGPAAWASRFDLSHWRFFAARAAGERVGGAAVVLRAPDVDMLRGRQDVALLWDIRVAPEMRGRGVGAALVAGAEAWSAAHGAAWIEVETQNVNVPACRFYERMGFVLREVHAHAYASRPDEVQLLWHKRISRGFKGQSP